MKKNATLVLSAAVAALIAAAPIASHASHSTLGSTATSIGVTASIGMTSPIRHDADVFPHGGATAFATGKTSFDAAKAAVTDYSYVSGFKAEGDYLALGKMKGMKKHKFRTTSDDLGVLLAENHAPGLQTSFTIA